MNHYQRDFDDFNHDVIKILTLHRELTSEIVSKIKKNEIHIINEIMERVEFFCELLFNIKKRIKCLTDIFLYTNSMIYITV
jgi:hypothetical protein